MPLSFVSTIFTESEIENCHLQNDFERLLNMITLSCNRIRQSHVTFSKYILLFLYCVCVFFSNTRTGSLRISIPKWTLFQDCSPRLFLSYEGSQQRFLREYLGAVFHFGCHYHYEHFQALRLRECQKPHCLTSLLFVL